MLMTTGMRWRNQSLKVCEGLTDGSEGESRVRWRWQSVKRWQRVEVTVCEGNSKRVEVTVCGGSTVRGWRWQSVKGTVRGWRWQSVKGGESEGGGDSLWREDSQRGEVTVCDGRTVRGGGQSWEMKVTVFEELSGLELSCQCMNASFFSFSFIMNDYTSEWSQGEEIVMIELMNVGPTCTVILIDCKYIIC